MVSKDKKMERTFVMKAGRKITKRYVGQNELFVEDDMLMLS